MAQRLPQRQTPPIILALKCSPAATPMRQMQITASVIVTTYNWPQALSVVLRALSRQSVRPLEVIVADDGSTDATRTLVHDIARNYPVSLRHVWQEDMGFRAARSRNRGIAASRGDYFVLLDGDMLVHRHFLADHFMLAAPGRFIQGGRLHASASETTRLLAGGTPRFHPFADLAFGAEHGLQQRHALRLPWLARKRARVDRDDIIMSCNMSFWRDDLLRVNGFDERMQGYGNEDLELAARLRNAGILCKRLIYGGLAIHLAHAAAVDDAKDLSSPNQRILHTTQSTGVVRCELGIDGHLDEFAVLENP